MGGISHSNKHTEKVITVCLFSGKPPAHLECSTRSTKTAPSFPGTAMGPGCPVSTVCSWSVIRSPTKEGSENDSGYHLERFTECQREPMGKHPGGRQDYPLGREHSDG